jgi:catechol 2,3-dioxygenase-like lactoylglutathione lyase family enzyme
MNPERRDMPFGLPPITDICFIVEDVERSLLFYRDRLGFTLRTRAPGFADFTSRHVALALWEIDHIAANIGISSKRSGPGVYKACAAIEVDAPGDVDALHDELIAAGVPVLAPPKDYPWEARCIYFTDPDDNLWELYAWLHGRRFGEVPPPPA